MIIIYLLEKNEIPFYVGKCNNINVRYSQHKKTYGGDINIKILELVKDKDWKIKERYYIALFKSQGFNLENKNKGGGGPTNLSIDSKQKIIDSKLGNAYKLKNIPNGKIEEMYKIKNIQEIANELNMSFATIKKYLVEKNLYIPDKNRKAVSEETKIKKSKLMKGKNTKPIYQFNLDGKLINKFDSLTDACILNNIPLKCMGDITSSCRGKQKTARGYLWSYTKTPPSSSYKNIRRNILQYDLEGNFIKEYSSAAQAGKEINQNGNSISDCLNKRQKTAFGYIWKYKN
jgi:hypothetical protein